MGDWRRLDLDETALREGWADESVPVKVLAKRLGCDPQTLRSRVSELGLPSRRRGAKPKTGLTDGEWVPNGRGVMVWRRDGAA